MICSLRGRQEQKQREREEEKVREVRWRRKSLEEGKEGEEEEEEKNEKFGDKIYLESSNKEGLLDRSKEGEETNRRRVINVEESWLKRDERGRKINTLI